MAASYKGARRRIAVDFDGVLHSYTSEWTGPVPIDPPTPGAQAFVQALIDAGYEVVVFTTRADTDEGRAATIDWLDQHQFPAVTVTAVKPAALVYIDDRAYRFDGDFESALAFAVDADARKPWGKKS